MYKRQIADWTRTGLTGRYPAAGVDADLEAALGKVATPLRAVLFQDDWLAPRCSLAYLLGKMRSPDVPILGLDAHALGVHADHFAWMRKPDAVAAALAQRD